MILKTLTNNNMGKIKTILIVLLVVSKSLPICSQGVQLKTKESKYPSFDKLFKLKWTFEDRNINYGKLLVYNGMIFCPGITGFCIDGKSGEKKSIDNNLNITNSDNEYFISVFDPINYLESVINISNGKTIFTAGFRQCPSFLLGTKLLIDSLYYYATEDNYIKAKDLNRPRRTLWKFPTEHEIRFKHIRYDSTFVVFTKKKLYLLNVLTGAKEWETEIEDLISDPVMIGSNIFFIAKNEQRINTLFSIDLQERKRNWSVNFPYSTPRVGLAAGNNMVCYVTNKGVHILDASTGKELHLIEGRYAKTVVSIVDDYAIAYNNDIESIQIGTGINIKTGKIDYQYFTSEGFPPKGEADMSDYAKKMKENGESDWWEGLGYNYLDGTDVIFVKDPTTGLVYGNSRGIVYCLEYIK